jgi:hypothetical protein
LPALEIKAKIIKKTIKPPTAPTPTTIARCFDDPPLGKNDRLGLAGPDKIKSYGFSPPAGAGGMA